MDTLEVLQGTWVLEPQKWGQLKVEGDKARYHNDTVQVKGIAIMNDSHFSGMILDGRGFVFMEIYDEGRRIKCRVEKAGLRKATTFSGIKLEYMKELEKKEKKEIQLALTKLSPIKKKKPKIIEHIQPKKGIVKEDKWCNTEGTSDKVFIGQKIFAYYKSTHDLYKATIAKILPNDQFEVAWADGDVSDITKSRKEIHISYDYPRDIAVEVNPFFGVIYDEKLGMWQVRRTVGKRLIIGRTHSNAIRAAMESDNLLMKHNSKYLLLNFPERFPPYEIRDRKHIPKKKKRKSDRTEPKPEIAKKKKRLAPAMQIDKCPLATPPRKKKRKLNEPKGYDRIDETLCMYCSKGDNSENLLLCDHSGPSFHGAHIMCAGLTEKPTRWFCEYHSRKKRKSIQKEGDSTRNSRYKGVRWNPRVHKWEGVIQGKMVVTWENETKCAKALRDQVQTLVAFGVEVDKELGHVHVRRRNPKKYYVVSMILDDRLNSTTGEQEFLVKWQDFGNEDNSWEPISNLRNNQCLRDYLAE